MRTTLAVKGLIQENLSFVNSFTFSEVTETDTLHEILKRNPKKVGMFGNIPIKIIYESSDTYNLAMKNIWSFEILEEQCFW